MFLGFYALFSWILLLCSAVIHSEVDCVIRSNLFCSEISKKRKSAVVSLAFIWSIGLLFGIAAANRSALFLTPMIRSCAVTAVSFWGLSVVTVLFFLLCAYAVIFCKALVYIFIACKGFAFGYCICGVAAAFGSAGWLIRGMLLFANIGAILPLFYFIIHHFFCEKRFCFCCFAVCLTASLFAVYLDHFFVSPFLVKLLLS